MRRTRRLSTIAVTIAGLTVSACGTYGTYGKGSSVDEPQIRAVIAGYTAAISSGDGARACSYLGGAMWAAFERQGRVLKLGGCAGYMNRLIRRERAARGRTAPEVEVTSIRISASGGNAVAWMKTPNGSTSRAYLIWDHPEGWKIAPDE